MPALTALLRETAERHDSFEKTHAQHRWSDWHAPYLSARQNGLRAGAARDPRAGAGTGPDPRPGVRGLPQRRDHEGRPAPRHLVPAGVRPMIEKYPLAEAAEAYARMLSGKAEFRV